MISYFRVEIKLYWHVYVSESDPTFRRVVSLDEYASHFSNIDPVAQYKRWTTVQESNCSKNPENIFHHGYSQKVKAAFVVSDPVDWGRDIQVFL